MISSHSADRWDSLLLSRWRQRGSVSFWCALKSLKSLSLSLSLPAILSNRCVPSATCAFIYFSLYFVFSFFFFNFCFILYSSIFFHGRNERNLIDKTSMYVYRDKINILDFFLSQSFADGDWMKSESFFFFLYRHLHSK